MKTTTPILGEPDLLTAIDLNSWQALLGHSRKASSYYCPIQPQQHRMSRADAYSYHPLGQPHYTSANGLSLCFLSGTS